ncbi:TRAP transporter large permease [Limnohabitans sp. Rim28]|uniref:TRAP transporter large permease n=1 Tax=Limnohabitans sp. Rim28 TaxID=1100720 RepID=UPI0003137355|nr:TRAP transporter large permease [Limnohabitans sp. Rim28]PVE06516.1 C4-dicarboxylate ABC transporter permease [Limnohabitans sp. Rim28]
MTDLVLGFMAIFAMLCFIILGMHIGIALIVTSFVAVWLMKSPEIAARFVGAAANDAIRDYLFGVVPLFVLMGMFVSISGVGRDTFDVFQWVLRRVRGGLGLATVGANAVFAAITGISIASASVFTKVATPEMIRHGYTPRFAVGVVAGSSVLGMLIPPSLLMIIYGVIAEESIGRMFMAGILPGLLLALLFCLLIIAMAYLSPARIFTSGNFDATEEKDLETWATAAQKFFPILILVVLVLGGLYSGFFTPTEAGAVGAAGAFLIALLRRRLDWVKLWNVLTETGYVSVSVLFLIIAASLYSRMLALTGLPAAITSSITDVGLGAWGFLVAYLVIVILLGCIIDSVSIMLIMLPIVLPIVSAFGMDKIWFGVLTVVAVEIGLLTPPFGVSVYTVKSALNNPSISVRDIFAGAFPFVLVMVLALVILALFPSLSTWLARM